MRKFIGMAMGVILMATAMVGCGSKDANGTGTESSKAVQETTIDGTDKKSDSKDAKSDFDTSSEITVVSREDGSGTRGAFIELMGIEQKNADGKKVDMTTEEAVVTNSTSVMMTTVAGDEYALGYISLGSLDDTVKAVKVDGVEATVDNIKSDKYKVSRPFNIATKGDVTGVAADFIKFIMSADGQEVITDNGYISVSEEGAFTSDNSEGKIVVAGSSSVTPVMQKLKEAYLKINTKAEIEIQESDSSTGMQAAIEGACDIGMASRDLKDSEKEGGLTSTVIAKDGIAVIVNNNCPAEDLKSEDIMKAFTGEVTEWSEIYE